MIPETSARALEDVAVRLRALRARLNARTSGAELDLSDVSRLTQDLDDALRDALSHIARVFALNGTISVPPSADEASTTLTTAYLDGLSRADGFDLLSSSIHDILSTPDLDVNQIASLLAASARLSGRIALASTSSVDRALALLQATALSRIPPTA